VEDCEAVVGVAWGRRSDDAIAVDQFPRDVDLFLVRRCSGEEGGGCWVEWVEWGCGGLRRMCTTVATAFASVFLGPCRSLIIVALIHNMSEVLQIEAQLGPAISVDARAWVRRFVVLACALQAGLCLFVGDLRTQVLALAASGAPIDMVNCGIAYHYLSAVRWSGDRGRGAEHAGHSGGRAVRILFFSSQFLHLSYVALTVVNCAFPPNGRLLAIPLNCGAVLLAAAFVVLQESVDDAAEDPTDHDVRDVEAAKPESIESRPSKHPRTRSPAPTRRLRGE
jgi:hypothetical protein